MALISFTNRAHPSGFNIFIKHVGGAIKEAVNKNPAPSAWDQWHGTKVNGSWIKEAGQTTEGEGGRMGGFLFEVMEGERRCVGIVGDKGWPPEYI